MRKTTSSDAGRGRPALIVVAVAILSLALHALVLGWSGSAMRSAPPASPPAVIVASLPQPQPQPQPQPEPEPEPAVQPMPEPARPLPQHAPPPSPRRPAARDDAPERAAAARPPGGRTAVAPAGAAEVPVTQPDADAARASTPVAVAPPAASEAAGDHRGGGRDDRTPLPKDGSDEPPVAEPEAPAGSQAAPQPSIEAAAADASAAPLGPPPESIELRFDAYLENLGGDVRIGDARFSLHTGDGRYRMTLEARGPLARFAYASSGLLGEHGFRPHRFSESRRVAFRARVARTVRLVTPLPPGSPPADGAPVDIPAEAPGDAAIEAITLQVPPDTQDRLSVLFQLWLLTRGHPERLVAGHEIVLPLASMKGYEQATFRVGPVEPFVLEARPVEAVRLTRVSGSARASGIEVWLAAQAPHLPVGLRYVERDRAVRFIATGPG